MAASRRVYDSRHPQADCKNRDQLRNPTLGNRVWASLFTVVRAQPQYTCAVLRQAQQSQGGSDYEIYNFISPSYVVAQHK